MRWSRNRILQELESERQLIMARFIEATNQPTPLSPHHHLRWYLDISKQWAVHHLCELSKRQPGKLLDVGSYYGLIAGVGHKMGWNVTAVDVISPPTYSTLNIPERKIDFKPYNACLDDLPFEAAQFDCVIMSETLEHLTYNPLRSIKEISRVLRPGAVLLLSTPNPAGLGKIVSLCLGSNPIEPHLSTMLLEDDIYIERGMTFFKSNREAKLYTANEIRKLFDLAGLKTGHFYRYGNSVRTELASFWGGVKVSAQRVLQPISGRFPFGGGSTFIVGVKP